MVASWGRDSSRGSGNIRHVVRAFGRRRRGWHARHARVYRCRNTGIIVREMAWVRKLGNDEFAVVFQHRAAVVEFLEAIAVDGDEFLIIARAAVLLGATVVV